VLACSSSPSVLLDVVTEADTPPQRLDAAESIRLLQTLSLGSATVPRTGDVNLGVDVRECPSWR